MTDEERDMLEVEAMFSPKPTTNDETTPEISEQTEAPRKPLKLVVCEACPETIYEKDAVRANGMLLCKRCAARETDAQVTARVLEYKPSAEFPRLNQPARLSQTSIPNNDLDVNSEEYQHVFNESRLQIAAFPDDQKLTLIRERIDQLDAFMRKARIQRQAMFVAIDDLYTNATEQERGRLLEQDKLHKARNPRKSSEPKAKSGEVRLNKREQSYPSHWTPSVRKAATVFLDMGMTLVQAEEKMKQYGIMK